jgi:hypothetical protein
MDASLNSSNLLYTDGRPDDINMSFGRMLLTDKRPDVIVGRPDGCLGSNFFDLEFAQNLP